MVYDKCVEGVLPEDPNGKLFTAQPKNSANMKELSDQLNLKDRLISAHKQGCMLQCGFGALNQQEFISEEVDCECIDEPAFFHHDKSLVSGKSAAKANVDVALKVRSLVEELYRNEISPFYHAFTRYHFGVLCMYFTQMENSN